MAILWPHWSRRKRPITLAICEAKTQSACEPRIAPHERETIKLIVRCVGLVRSPLESSETTAADDGQVAERHSPPYRDVLLSLWKRQRWIWPRPDGVESNEGGKRERER